MKMSPGKYLLLVSVAYIALALLNAFVDFIPTVLLEILWLLTLGAPIVIKPLGLWVGLKKWWH